MNTDKSWNTSRRFKFTLSYGQLRKFHYKLWGKKFPKRPQSSFFSFKIYLQSWYGSGKWFCDSISVLSLLPFCCSVVTVSHIFLRIINENSFKKRLSFFIRLFADVRFLVYLQFTYHLSLLKSGEPNFIVGFIYISCTPFVFFMYQSVWLHLDAKLCTASCSKFIL